MGRGGVCVVRDYTFDSSLRSLWLRIYSFCACAYLMRDAGILIRVFIPLLYIAIKLLDFTVYHESTRQSAPEVGRRRPLPSRQ